MPKSPNAFSLHTHATTTTTTNPCSLSVQALSQCPNHPNALVGRAALLANSGFLTEAAADLEKALAEEGSDASDGSGGGGDRVASWARDAQRAWGAPPSPPCAQEHAWAWVRVWLLVWV